MNTSISTLKNEEEVALFKKLIQFKTISAEGPKGEYKACCDWLQGLLSELGFNVKIVEPVANHPVLVATLLGQEPDLPSVVLNSHYDVVPVMMEEWNCDPFAGIEKDGKIYGRGTQDMKCVCIQYLLALRRLASQGIKNFKRTLHLVYVPDEEIGGKDGMKAFIDSGMMKELCGNVGIVMDEGLANTKDKYTVFYGERVPLWITVISSGPTGHGSRFIPETAVEKLIGVANKAFEFRKAEEAKLGYLGGCKYCQSKKLGDVTTINLTMLRAGVSLDNGETFSLNVIPTKAEAGFDVRVPPTFPISEVEAMLDSWTKDNGLSWEYAKWTSPCKSHNVTSTDRATNPWWAVFEDFCNENGFEVETEIFPAATDSRFLRGLGIDALGFSPMKKSPILLHEHNEYLERSVFLEGIDVYVKLIQKLTNASHEERNGNAAKKQKVDG